MSQEQSTTLGKSTRVHHPRHLSPCLCEKGASDLIINAGIWISSVNCCREISTAGRAGRLGGRSRVIYCNASACVASSSAAHILLQRGFSSHLSLDCMYYGEVLYRHSCLRDGLAQGSRSTPRLSMRAIPSEDSLACRCSMALAARQQLSPIQ
jgi:hypothetical protein